MENNISKKENNSSSYKDFPIDVSNFLIEFREMMNKTINEFVYDMGWSNDKYYSKIVNGYYSDNIKKYSHPTVNYLFGGIKYAITNNKDYYEKREEIIKLINKYFLNI